MSDAQPIISAGLSVPIADTESVEAALKRNAAERRLLNRLLKLCWARDHERRYLAGGRQPAHAL